MIRFVLIFIVFIEVLIMSCTFNKKEEEIKNIQGNWVFDASNLPDIGSDRVISKIRDNCGFEFHNDSCHMRCAFYQINESINVCDGMKTGFVTNFDIKNDSLRIWDVERKSWHTYLIKSLTKDSLVLFDQNMQYDVKYIRPSNPKNIFFDGIVISKLFLGGGYECVDESFYFDRQGCYYYKNSNDKRLVYRLNQKTINSVFDRYDYLDINSLKSEYIGGGTGASVHYSIAFIKNGTVIKRVIDHQNTGPDELLQGYITTIAELRKSNGERMNIENNVLKLVEKEVGFFYQKMGLN